MFFRKTKIDVVEPIQKEKETIDDQEYRRSESPVGAYWADRRFLDVIPFRDIVFFLLALTLAAGIMIVGYALRSILGPVLIALLLAYLFDPVVTLAKARTSHCRRLCIRRMRDQR